MLMNLVSFLVSLSFITGGSQARTQRIEGKLFLLCVQY